MPSIPYVSSEALATAQAWERRFQMLPPEAGILFVSISPEPEQTGNCYKFIIRLGIKRPMERATAEALMKNVMEEELRSGRYIIMFAAYNGISGGAARVEDTPSSRPASPQ